MISPQEYQLESKDGLPLHSIAWKIPSPTFNICLVHGLGEHSGRYAHVASFYNNLGANVYALDLRGHGKSGGARGCGPNLDAFFNDIDALLSHMNIDSPNLDWMFHLHSMGANIGLNYVLRKKPTCRAVVATGPWITLESDPSKTLIVVANLINKFGGFTQASGIDANLISTDPIEVTKYANDPLNHDKISSKAGMALYYSGQYLYTYKGGIQIPTLIMHAEKDKLTLASGSKQFVENNPANVSFKIWKDVYHELHNDVKRDEMFQHIEEWLKNNKIFF